MTREQRVIMGVLVGGLLGGAVAGASSNGSGCDEICFPFLNEATFVVGVLFGGFAGGLVVGLATSLPPGNYPAGTSKVVPATKVEAGPTTAEWRGNTFGCLLPRGVCRLVVLEAAAGGPLRADDEVLAVRERVVTSLFQISGYLEVFEKDGRPITFTVRRGGEVVVVEAPASPRE